MLILFMKCFKKVVLEIMLVFASVLVFRSLWSLMDKVPLLNQTITHFILLIIGFTISIYTIHKLIHK